MVLSSIAGRTAIVTGAGSGINLAFSHALLSKHCNVVFADLRLRPEAEELVANHSRVSAQSPARAVFQKTDVTKWQQLRRMFDIATNEFGGADIVCPGAGLFDPPSSNFWNPPTPYSSTIDDDSSYATISANLTHPIRTTQLALSHFLSGSSSLPRSTSSSPKSVIHITSIAGQITPLVTPLYVASKHGLSGFVRSLAPLEERLGIRVAAVAPGIVRTGMFTDQPEKMRMVAQDGRDSWVSAEDVAGVMVKLAEGGEVEVIKKKGKETVNVEGGLILEVQNGSVRVVKQFMDEGPSGEGTSLSELEPEYEKIFKRLEDGRWGLDEAAR